MSHTESTCQSPTPGPRAEQGRHAHGSPTGDVLECGVSYSRFCILPGIPYRALQAVRDQYMLIYGDDRTQGIV